MIVNIHILLFAVQKAVIAAASLPWSAPQLQNNAIIVGLIIIFAATDLLACHPKGILRHQLAWLSDTRNARTFEASSIVYPWLKPLLFAQLFIFTCLNLFCIFDEAPAVHLSAPDLATWQLLAYCLLVPLFMLTLQYFGYNWFCYLFRTKSQQIIMNRTYLAALLLLSPLATLIFIGTMISSFSIHTTLILLAALFILSQILFIFSGFRIFLRGFGSFFIIIVYLCTLEIAPLWVIWIKFST